MRTVSPANRSEAKTSGPGSIPARVRANALVITVIVSFLLAILSLGMIVLAGYDRDLRIRMEKRQRLDRNARSAMNLVLADTGYRYTNDTVTKDLFAGGADPVLIARRPWGVFGIGLTRAMQGSDTSELRTLYGAPMPEWLRGCLYLVDHDRVLSLVGNARLSGDGFLPKLGLRIAYIDQRGFDRDRLIEGHTLISEKAAPPVDSALIGYLYRLIDTVGETFAGIHSTLLPDTLVRRFDDQPLVIRAHGILQIGHSAISGQCLIRSDSLIEVNAEASLHNVLLVAPVIRIRDGFSGSLQLIAGDSIRIGDRCHLNYPSALVLLRKANQADAGRIRMGVRDTVDGSVMSLSKEKDPNKPATEVFLGDSSLINGVLYVNGFLTMRGAVHGAVLTDYFLIRQGSSILVNYLVDAEIDRKAIPTGYVGPLLFSEKKPNRIVQWLR